MNSTKSGFSRFSGYKRRKAAAFLCVLLVFACLLLSCGNAPSSFRGSAGSTLPPSGEGCAPLSPGGLPDGNAGSGDLPADSAGGDEPPPPSLPDRKVSVLAVGDDLIHRGIYRNAAAYARETGKGEYDFTPIFEYLKEDIAGADLSIINQETMFDPEQEPSNYPTFNTPDEIADDLGALGFDVVSLANNHMLDVGSAGLLRTIERLDKVSGVTRVGAYKDQADMDAVRVLEKNGLRIAVVAFTYGTNGRSPSENVKIPYLTEENVRSQLEKAEAAADFTLVFVHWGEEYRFDISDSQRSFASLFAECGADVIIGSHPHVIQPIEWVEKTNGEKILCAYSLGNLVAMQDTEKNMLGGVLTFDIVSRSGGEAKAENFLFSPTVYYYRNSDWFGNKIYYLENFTDELAASHGIGHYGNTMKVDNLYKLTKQYIPAEFLPESVKKDPRG